VTILQPPGHVLDQVSQVLGVLRLDDLQFHDLCLPLDHVGGVTVLGWLFIQYCTLALHSSIVALFLANGFQNLFLNAHMLELYSVKMIKFLLYKWILAEMFLF
jgi:hypothetical protein